MNWKFALTLIWIVFTLSLATWWMIFGLQQSDQLHALLGDQSNEKLLRQHSMLLWEGGILLLSLLAGGIALFNYALSEKKQKDRLKEFFATFSHELKTSLTSLRLQAEALQEDFAENTSPLLPRLVSDTVRLEIQLENSLFLANADKRKLFIEDVDVAKLIESLNANWPGLSFKIERGAIVRADHRALESVLKNLFYNSLVHGDSQLVRIEAKPVGSDRVCLCVEDDGNGFKGDLASAGQLFHRQTSTSGSGMGLFLVRKLTEEMAGNVEFKNGEHGFLVNLQLPGQLESKSPNVQEGQP